MSFRRLRGTCGIACVVAVLAALAQTARAQDRQLFMLVTDRSGQPVADVTADEVVLEQEGSECTVKDVQLDAAPMKVALLVDNSDAAQQSLNSMRDGLAAFLDTLPAEHEVGLFTIAGQVRRRVDFTTDREDLKEQATGLFVDRNSGVVYLDGLVETWERRFEDEDLWPVFVSLVYDGAEASRSVQDDEFNEFARELVGRGATVHAILVSTRGGAIQTTISTFLTQNTGGMYRALAAATALPETFTELAETMGAQYETVKDRYRVLFECDPDNPAAGIAAGVSRAAVGVRLFPNRRTDQ